jgi:hypothetical protein
MAWDMVKTHVQLLNFKSAHRRHLGLPDAEFAD